MFLSVPKLASFALLWSQVAAFVVQPSRVGVACTSRRAAFSSSLSSPLLFATAQDASDKYYNLEEMEDKESCRTELLLNTDGTVTFGGTDGPIFSKAVGEWDLKADDEFRLVLMRTYETGRETTEATDMGEFSFDVERIFTGTLKHVGEKVAMEGVIHLVDVDFGDRKVGFFEMIDTTEERLGLTEEEAEALLMKGKKISASNK